MANFPENKKDSNKYKWGLFYYNPNNPKLWVPKVDSILGSTLNFAQPLAYIFILILLMVVVLATRLHNN